MIHEFLELVHSIKVHTELDSEALKEFCLSHKANFEQMDSDEIQILSKPFFNLAQNWSVETALEHHRELLNTPESFGALDFYNGFLAQVLKSRELNEGESALLRNWLQEILPLHWDARLARLEISGWNPAAFCAEILEDKISLGNRTTRERDLKNIWQLFLDSERGLEGSNFSDIYLNSTHVPVKRWNLTEFQRLKSSRGFKSLPEKTRLKLLQKFAINLSSKDLAHFCQKIDLETTLLLVNRLMGNGNAQLGKHAYQVRFLLQSLLKSDPMNRRVWETFFKVQDRCQWEEGFKFPECVADPELWLRALELLEKDLETSKTAANALARLRKHWHLPPYEDLRGIELPVLPDLEKVTRALIDSGWQWKRCFPFKMGKIHDKGPLFEIYVGNLLGILGVKPVFWSVKRSDQGTNLEEMDLVFQNKKTIYVLELKTGGKCLDLSEDEKKLRRKSRRTSQTNVRLGLVCPNLIMSGVQFKRIKKMKVSILESTSLPNFVTHLARICNLPMTSRAEAIQRVLTAGERKFGENSSFGKSFRFKKWTKRQRFKS